MSADTQPYIEHERFEVAEDYPSLAYKQGREQCFTMVYEDGNTYYVHIQEPPTKRNLNRSRKTIQRDLLVYTTKTFPSAPDGIYAWLQTDLGFYAVPVRNILEFGSRHIQIADRVGVKKVFMGGELEKMGNNIVYNLLSGSFMRDLSYLYPHYDFKPNASRLFTDMGLTPLFTDKTLIVMPVSLADLRYYKSLGYRIWLFETKNACDSASWALDPTSRDTIRANYEKALRKLEEYQEGVRKAEEDYRKALENLAELEAKPTEIPVNANNNTRKRLLRQASSARADVIYVRDSALQRMRVYRSSVPNVLEELDTLKSLMTPIEFVGGGRRKTRRRNRNRK